MLRPILACLLLTACGSLGSEAITPDLVRLDEGHGGVARVVAFGNSTVSADDLTEAMIISIEASGIFDGAIEEGESDWILSAQLVSLHEPEWSIDMHADATIRWQLSDPDGKVLWTERIKTEAKVGPQGADSLGERAEMATGNAVRDNLIEALERIADLDLKP